MGAFRKIWRSLALCTMGFVVAMAATAALPAAGSDTKPLRFEPSGDGRGGFISHGQGASLLLDASGLVLKLDGGPGDRRAVLRTRLAGARATPRLKGTGEAVERRSYFLGQREQWRADVPQYAGVRSEGIYPGIDLIVRAEHDRWEYDFAVAPGASPGAIRLCFEGAAGTAIDARGDLLVRTRAGEVRHTRPRIYQEIDGQRVPVSGRFVKKGRRTIGFRVGPYDRNRPLVIDPAIVFASEASTPGEDAYAVAVDPAGSTYLAGTTGTGPSGRDAFVRKLDAAGVPVYTTYLGGSLQDFAVGLAVDSAGNVYLTGETDSPNFPVTPDALQGSYGDPDIEQGDAFVAKLDPAGSLVYASYLGGDAKEEGTGIALDAEGNLYLTGETDSFDDPETPEVEPAFPLVNPIGSQPGGNYGLTAYVTKLSPSFSILFSTVIPGTEVGQGIAVDAMGDVYVAGETARDDLPTAGGLQPTLGSPFQNDAFVVKLRPAQSQLVYATYLGGSQQDGAFGLAVDGMGHAYVTGITLSQDFPVQNPFQPELANSRFYDAFVAKLDPSGSSLVYSTYLGGSVVEEGFGIAVDGTGNVLVTGVTFSGGEFPILRAPQRMFGGGPADAFLIKLDPAGVPVYSTYLGDDDLELARAVALDANGEPRVAGYVPESGWFAFHLDNSYTYNPAFTDSNDDVVVEPEDATTQTKPVTLTFASVTVAGETSLATSGTGPAPPSGFQLGDPPTYYELATTATFQGTISICIRYAGVSYTDESQLTLWHFENGSWTDVTASRDTDAQVICGVVTSLSPFAIFEPVDAVYGFVGFLPPVRNDGSSLFRAGRTVPVKFQLNAVDGTLVTNAVARLQVHKITDAVLGSEEEITPVASGGNPDDLFRFDPDAGQYVYVLDTSGFTPGTYRLRAVLDDGTAHEVQVSVR